MDADVAIDAYWQHYLLSRSTVRADRLAAENFFWAYEWVDAVIAGELKTNQPKVDPIELMRQLARRAPDDIALAYLGGGPIENYLRRPGADIDAIEGAGRRERSFRTALRCAWFDDLPRDDVERLRRFGPPL